MRFITFHYTILLLESKDTCSRMVEEFQMKDKKLVTYVLNNLFRRKLTFFVHFMKHKDRSELGIYFLEEFHCVTSYIEKAER